MAGDQTNDHGKNETFEEAIEHVSEIHDQLEIDKEGLESDPDFFVTPRRDPRTSRSTRRRAPKRAGNGDGHKPGQHKVMNRIDVHRAQRVDFLINLHGADFRRHGGTDAPGNQHCHHDRSKLLADGQADESADNALQATLGRSGPVCNAMTPPMKRERRQAINRLALPIRTIDRKPFADGERPVAARESCATATPSSLRCFEHPGSARFRWLRQLLCLAHGNIEDANAFAFRAGFIPKQTEQERALFLLGGCIPAVEIPKE
jgi:hypothetical protein